ncbi:MAG TPA: ABC transporter ATP-binding protein [Candidatus Thermoplasmatota archaeon]|nr:ABC transporter ATP-binding protein [Candidatus Thermoplasmatota archaeon]
MEPAIEARGLTRTFQKRKERGWRAWIPGPRETTTALRGVDLEVQRGELFGLLGPNAAGKTTLVKVLSTLLLPTSGEARVLGHDVAREADAVRRKVGVVLGGERALYWRLTARENLWYFSQLYDLPEALAKERIDRLLGVVGLAERADERVESYSKGMKQRLHIARGLLHEPEILLLDEPTIGLDPAAARALRLLVRDLVDHHGRTVVLTTHYMYEADALSDRVAILSRGRIVACDTPRSLKGKFAQRAAWQVKVRAPGAGIPDSLRALPGVAHVAEQGEAGDGTLALRVLARDGAGGELGAELAQAIAEQKGRLVALAREEPTLEDVFVSLTGEGLGGRADAEAGDG